MSNNIVEDLNKKLSKAIITHNSEQIRNYVNQGADVNYIDYSNNDTPPLLLAIINSKKTVYSDDIYVIHCVEDITIVELLIELKADVHFIDHYNNNLLHHAIFCTNFEIIQLLILHQVNINKVNNDDQTPLELILHKLSQPGIAQEQISIYIKMIDILVSNQADINRIDNQGFSTFHFALYNPNPQIIKIFLTHKVDLNNQHPLSQHNFILALLQFSDLQEIVQEIYGIEDFIKYQGYNDLHLHITSNPNDFLKLIEISQNPNIDINMKTKTGYTALHLAILHHIYDYMMYLLKPMNADINEVDKVGNSAIFYTVFTENKALTNSLLTFQPNLNIPNKDGKTPIMYTNDDQLQEILVYHGSNFLYGWTPLHYYITKNDFTRFHKSIESYPHNKDIKDNIYGDTPLHLALRCATPEEDNINYIEKLLALDVDITIKNNSGDTPLHIAALESCLNGIITIANYSERKKLLQNIINDINNNGDTPLHLAASNKAPEELNIKICTKLIELGANLNILNSAQESIIDKANQNHKLALKELILQYIVPHNINDTVENISISDTEDHNISTIGTIDKIDNILDLE